MSDQLTLFSEHHNDHDSTSNSLSSMNNFNPDQYPLLIKQLPMAFVLAKDVCLSFDNLDDRQLAFYCIVLVADALKLGDICVDLERIAHQPALSHWEIDYSFPALDQFTRWLKQQTFIHVANKDKENNRAHSWQAPLIKQPLLLLYGNFLYLSKWADIEHRLSLQLHTRSQLRQAFSSEYLSQFINDKNPSMPVNWQDIAVVNSLLSPLSFIVGGPGTGKTTTLASLLKGIIRAEGHSQYRIALAAPTGKAAARMLASLTEKVSSLALSDDTKALLPSNAQTLHRLLGWMNDQRQFRFNASNKLLLDCLIIDEVSMIDMAMFTALLEALPDRCRVILLGDPYQLSSVSAGNVLAEICQAERLSHFSAARCKQFAFMSEQISEGRISPLMDNIVCLQKSYRFSESAGIGLLASACLRGDEKALSFAVNEPEISLFEKNASGNQALADRLYTHYDALYACDDVHEAFDQLSQFQLLCAVKEGDYSSQFFNQLMLNYATSRQHFIAEHAGISLYHGMPIMMEINHHHLSLYNGDMGIVWLHNRSVLSDTSDQKNSHSIMAQWSLFFVLADGSVADFLPSELTGWQPAHAITVHKSQGSEYDEVALACPDIDSPLLNKAMLYTAITRSKQHFYCLANQDELSKAIHKTSERHSALQLRLEGHSH